ncbi:MAG: PEP-CTERM sorting domain-containing protein, partial [Phycisphaerae bacterium]|nr:PEP-CTERM sorting domain-containing protein [Phycisphaerae bacterium]
GSVSNKYGLVGAFDDANGQLTVRGSGSTWTSSEYFSIGMNAAGTLLVENGGTVVSDKDGYIAQYGAVGHATVTGPGSSLTTADRLYVAACETGTLSIQDGGVVSCQSVVIGDQFNSDGAVTVTGPGSRWDITINLIVGDDGQGALMISDQAAAAANVIGVGSVYDPISPGLAPVLTVTGAGSSLSANAAMQVRETGAVNVLDGATASAGMVSISGGAQAGGQLLVQGAGSSCTYNQITVGSSGFALLRIDGGGSASGNAVIGGFFADANGAAVVSGQGSGLSMTDTLVMGCVGSGELTVEQGASVINGGPAGLGLYVGAHGTITVTGPGSVWQNDGAIYVGGDTPGAGGTGNINVEAAGRLAAGDTITIWNTGTVNLVGGILQAPAIDNSDGGTFSFTAGTLSVGEFIGDLSQSGGTMCPGLSPGMTSIDGDYYLLGGSMEAEINGYDRGDQITPDAVGYDAIDVTGSALLDAGVAIVLLDGFEPLAGDMFDLLTAQDIELGSSFSFDTSAAALSTPGLSWQWSVIDVSGGQAIRLLAVPEPATFSLLALGGVGLLGRRRR